MKKNKIYFLDRPVLDSILLKACENDFPEIVSSNLKRTILYDLDYLISYCERYNSEECISFLKKERETYEKNKNLQRVRQYFLNLYKIFSIIPENIPYIPPFTSLRIDNVLGLINDDDMLGYTLSLVPEMFLIVAKDMLIPEDRKIYIEKELDECINYNIYEVSNGAVRVLDYRSHQNSSLWERI